MELFEQLKTQAAPIAQRKDSMAMVRQQAYEKFVSQGVPTRHNESWKYSALSKFLKEEISFNDSKSKVGINDHIVKDFDNIIILDGELLLNETKIEINPIDNIDYSQSDFITNDPMYNYNMSSLQGGHEINIEKNQSFEKPVIVTHLFANTKSIYSQANKISIGSGSKLSIVEVYKSLGKETLLNTYSKIVIEANANLTHCQLQKFEDSSTIINSLESDIEGHGVYSHYAFTVSGKFTRNTLNHRLNKEGAFAQSHGLYTLQDKEHCDTHSLVEHVAPHTDSAQLFKSILNDASRGVFTGLVKVHRDAQLINSTQLNKNLLLTKKSQANSRPQLEIYADDVKCAHGSTTGQLSEQELFYFESRGISKDRARKMLAQAFAYDVLLKIENIRIRDFIGSHIVTSF